MRSQKTFQICLVFGMFFQLTALINPTGAQVTQNVWLAGGSAAFASRSYSNIKDRDLMFAPKVGYFALDKFAPGLSVRYDREVGISSGLKTIANTISIGPFVRYYFLHPDNQINFLGEVGYQIGQSKSNNVGKRDNTNLFSIGAGPTFFLNSTAAVELLAEYNRISYGTAATQKAFLVNLGFQLYLER